jgi:transketolase
LRDTFGESAPNEPILKKYGITPEDVADAARGLLAYK